MKSSVFHKKYLLAGIYIIFVLFTCCNSRFYNTPLAKICSVTEKQTLSREGTRNSKEYYYTQKITARILNGAHKGEKITIATVYKGNIIKNLIMDCQSYTKYRPNETTGGIFVSWRRKEELPTGA